MKTAVEINSELKNFLKVKKYMYIVHTVRRRLKESGLNARVARQVPLISLKKKRKCRYSFAKKFSDWTPENRKKIFFNDEFKFNLINSDCRSFAKWRVNESFNRKCVTFTVKYGGGHFMYWGGFSGSGVGHLIEDKRTLNQNGNVKLLRDQFLLFSTENLARGQVVQQDNAPS